MNPMLFAFLVPVLFTVLQLRTGKYIFSALITGSCALISAFYAPLLCAALTAAVVGDWLMAHKGSNELMYAGGIGGFFVSHLLLYLYARTIIPEGAVLPAPVGAALIACIVYLVLRVLPKVPRLLAAPVALYTVISILSLGAAVKTGHALYALGVASLLFSDIMIAENDFVGNRQAGILILPTYYLSHLLMTLSVML